MCFGSKDINLNKHALDNRPIELLHSRRKVFSACNHLSNKFLDAQALRKVEPGR